MSLRSKINAIVLLLLISIIGCQLPEPEKEKSPYYLPWEELQELFVDVQMAGVFPDSKTFVDCTPKETPDVILQKYRDQKGNSDFDLATFVEANFDMPKQPDNSQFSTEKKFFEDHLDNHWDYLTRTTVNIPEHTTLIKLPGKYVVPGGRFREIYYWDSYFTMLGLEASNRPDLFKAMLDNFAFLIDSVGFIPNGNRSYYLGRSQPPYFAAMVEKYSQFTSPGEAVKYLDQVQKEYDFWMVGSDRLNENNNAIKRVVKIENYILNRYWDDFNFPRPESHREDYELAENVSEEKKPELYRHIRAAAESGWDFSTRWFEDVNEFSTIRTTEILPIDLNSLLFNTEELLAVLYDVSGDEQKSNAYRVLADSRKEAINKFFWNDDAGMYQDILWGTKSPTGFISAASFYPMYFGTATEERATTQTPILLDTLLLQGGIVTTRVESGQQWDYPNGWAPLQWIAIKGMENFGLSTEADDVAARWLAINKKVFSNTGKMMEKYNVVDTTLIAGGGEYPTQDGFGWTNGVALGLLKELAIY